MTNIVTELDKYVIAKELQHTDDSFSSFFEKVWELKLSRKSCGKNQMESVLDIC